MTSIVSGSEKRHSDPVLSKDGRDFLLASLLTYDKCPQDITHILLTSQTLNENVSSSPAENIATDEMWEYQQYSEKMGSWGSTKEHFVEYTEQTVRKSSFIRQKYFSIRDVLFLILILKKKNHF